MTSGELEPISALAQTLRDYGLWSVLAIALIALVWVSRAYVKVRDDHAKSLDGLYASSIEKVERMIEAVTRQASTNEQISRVLLEIERRLENVERQQEK